MHRGKHQWEDPHRGLVGDERLRPGGEHGEYRETRGSQGTQPWHHQSDTACDLHDTPMKTSSPRAFSDEALEPGQSVTGRCADAPFPLRQRASNPRKRRR